jgi:hypothetical protein
VNGAIGKSEPQTVFTQKKEGITTYYHRILAAAIVKPGSNAALPLTGEMISSEDENEKQDCGRNAAERRFSARDRP